MKEMFDRALDPDDRTIAPVLGVALLFGITAVGLSLWQTTVVPEQNAEVEFNHYSEVEGDMQELRQAHLRAVRSGQQTSLSPSSNGYETVKRLEPAARPNVTIATNIPASEWREFLESEMDAGYVTGVTDTSDGVEISLGGTPGESTTIEMTDDTEQLDTSSVGDAELEAETRDDTDTQTVTIESPVIEDPFLEDVPAGQERLNHSMGFTLGEDVGQSTIKIDLTDTGDNVSYDGNSDSNWTVVEGNGSISGLNTNNNQVTSVKYQTNSTDDREGDRIVLEADYTDTTGADTDSSTTYDVTYEVTSSNTNGVQGETNATSFETTVEE